MNGTKLKVGNPYQFDWEDEEDMANQVFVVTPQFRSSMEVWEPELDLFTHDTKKRASVRPDLTRKYIVSFGWLAFYIWASIVAGAVSAFLLAREDYVFLPASLLAFVSFAVLALVRLSIHIREHRDLRDHNRFRDAA
jgi:hypothetical protein